jgi:alkane 1-monooxygenase
MARLVALVFPLFSTIFVWTAPHGPALAASFVAVLILAITLDAVASPETRPPVPGAAWGYDAILLAAVAIQAANVAGLACMARFAPGPDTAVGVLLVGTSSGYSAIVVAHELVHRRGAMRILGRLLLGTVLYDHFATEHVRGHHKRVGTPDDPATARRGERFWPFLARTVPGQLRSAWRLEAPRGWRNRVLHGALLEVAGVAALGLALGPYALAAFLAQAALAVLLLEAVNYVEHWGIVRDGARPGPRDAWDADSWLTYYTLVGLSRHADHHAHAARPWHALRHVPESPKMPWGYFATVICALFWNARLRARLEAALPA